MESIRVAGRIDDIYFQKAKSAADGISRSPNVSVEVLGFTPADWDMYVDKLQVKDVTSNLVIFRGNNQITIEQFLADLKEKYSYNDIRPIQLFRALANTQYKQYIEATKHELYFLEISIGKSTGKLVFELFNDMCPKTVQNFIALCTGEKGKGSNGNKLHYVNTLLHRVIPGGWVQGGDICGGTGAGGESIYGETFADENFILKHTKAGILGMTNKGPHTNSSQFYITLNSAPWMDTKYVAFGQLVEGYRFLQQIAGVATQNERPIEEVRIVNAGKFVYK